MFRRQHLDRPDVLDLFWWKAKLAVGIDGKAADHALVNAKDAARSQFLRQWCTATTRIPTKLVLEDIDAVARRLFVICDERLEQLMVPFSRLGDGPPPLASEDS